MLKPKALYFSTTLLFLTTLSFAQSSMSGIVINEILPDPSGTTYNFDTDGDTGFEANDEFIELYNTTGTPVDISGWQIWDAGSLNWFTFPVSTFIPANGYVVVVGGWDGGGLPANYFSAGNAANTGVINNGGDNIIILNPAAIPPTFLQATFNGNILDDPLAYTGFPAGAIIVPGLSEDFGFDVDGQSVKRVTDGASTFTTTSPTPLASNALLPITLISFTAKPTATETVTLNWATASEENNEYFSIEHSVDGRSFTAIDRVLGVGTTTEMQQYEFMHRNPGQGNNYYRLRQVDFDGTFSFSPTAVVELKSYNEINVQPTLAHQNIELSIAERLNFNGAVEVFNAMGQLVKTTIFPAQSSTISINVGDLQSGHYMLRVNTENGIIASRFVKL